jgi:eukaryotic-like serine/threonine-protein kinase
MAMAAPAPLLPGSRLGRYELIRGLAVGGMAEIHLARAGGLEGFSKLVVVKRILPQLALDDELVRLFLAEARLAATLHHPNIVEVFDVGVEDGSHFMAMEYVRGENLAQVIAAAAKSGCGLPLSGALAVIAGVAEGLHHAHEQLGIVHRDVSPSNVLLTYDGRVKVCDFGIAKVAARHAHTTGAPRGKLAYMSPEQVRGEPVDRRSDLFAIGIMLYELTTGRRLFRGASDHEVATKICDHDVPAPSSVRPGYPPALERIVLRALRRDPSERHATAQELQIEIEELARTEQLVLSPVSLARYLRDVIGEPPAAETTPVAVARSAPPRRRRAIGPFALGLVVAGAAVSAGVLAFGGPEPRRDAEPPAVSAPAETGTPPATEVTVAAPVAEPAPAPVPQPPSRRTRTRPKRPMPVAPEPAPSTPEPEPAPAIAEPAPVLVDAAPAAESGRPPLQ